MDLSVLHTADLVQREGFAYSGGRYFTRVSMTMSAVVITRPGTDDLWLYDAGLGESYEDEMKGMPWWFRTAMSNIRPTRTARELLGPLASSVRGIILSHIHYDHISGASDFPGVDVVTPPNELEWASLQNPGHHGIVPGMIRAVGDSFRPLTISPLPGIEPFTEGHDLFGDGSVLLIPVHGHTPGSLLMLAKRCDGQDWLFIGDETWQLRALELGKGKPWFVRWIADVDSSLLLDEIRAIADLARKVNARVVPAHDREAYAGLPTSINLEEPRP